MRIILFLLMAAAAWGQITVVTSRDLIMWPPPQLIANAGGSSPSIDLTTEKIALTWTVLPGQDKQITAICIGHPSATPGVAASVQLETLPSTDIYPNGTLAATNTSATATLTTGRTECFDLTAAYTPAVGARMAAVLLAPSSAYTTFHLTAITGGYGFSSGSASCFHHNGTSWGVCNSPIAPITVKYSDGSYLHPSVTSATTTLGFNATRGNNTYLASSSAKQQGVEFVAKHTMRVVGMYAFLNGAAAATNLIRGYVYDANNTLLCTTADVPVGGTIPGLLYLPCAAPTWVAANATIRPVVLNVDAAATFNVNYQTFTTTFTNCDKTITGVGSAWKRIYRATTGDAWTEDATTILSVGIVADSYFAPSGGFYHSQ